MSRYRFSDFAKEIKAEKDIFGNTLLDWQKYGWLGYDSPLETYFIQLDKDEDYPTVWYGYSCGEIKSPYFLIAIIRKLFKSDIEFNNKLINSLIKERDDSYKEEPNLQGILSDLENADIFWKENIEYISGKYVKNGYYAGDNGAH